MNRGRVVTALVLLLAITASGVLVVHAKYLTRMSFNQLQEIRGQRDGLDLEWNHLRLEEAALSTDVRSSARRATSWACISPVSVT